MSDVMQRAGVNLGLCWHCNCCAGGCPFAEAMDYHPNGVIRLIQLGFKKKVLESSAIWICVGCNTCSVECPQAIDMPAIMDALRQMAMEEGVDIAEPDILNFHKEVLNSIKRYGRTHKLEIMLRYKIKQRDLFSDMDVGLKMLAKRKLDLTPSRVKGIEDIRQFFNNQEGSSDGY
ncbi:MAG: 4Fe-4S dicluster domain-containing protein [Deltaproteobacteria bacterium]|nr:4Fe-4S dicluster domain-containing protein [Deltaproteobacteria bacterium]MBW2219411.1 4Fe-4S dicluster domain-containing protein [Deltaproteobacteria bacterium]